MTDESQALIEQVIEKMAEAIYGDTDWKRISEDHWEKAMYRRKARAAFFAQNGLVRVMPVPTRDQFTHSTWAAYGETYCSRTDAGDLTR